MSNYSWQVYKRVIAVMMIVIFIASCGKEPVAEEASDSASTIENPELGVIQEDTFYVRLFDEGKFPFYMSKMGDFKTKCSIASGTSAQSLDCVLDINELDLYFHGISFQYNVPSGQCSYVQFNTYWYYNFEVGYGPSSFIRYETKDEDGRLTSSSCNIDGNTVANCIGVEATYADSGAKCKYDYSASGGPNCCMGTYTLTTTTTTPTGTTSTSAALGWGGNIRECIGGAGKTDWSEYNKAGYPLGRLYFTPIKGINERYDVKPPIKSSNAESSFPIANMYTSSKHTHSGYIDVRSSSVPYIIDPIDDRSGTPLYSGVPAYTWSCLDRNYELINQIRVYVREWNTNNEFIKYGTSKGASGDPDVAGVEGANCDYSTSLSGFCNDHIDLDDISTNTYNGTTKPLMFPKEKF